MPNSVNFAAWNIDPAFSAGAILNSPAGWTSQNNPSSTSFFGAPGSEVDLGNYLVSVEISEAKTKLSHKLLGKSKGDFLATTFLACSNFNSFNTLSVSSKVASFNQLTSNTNW